MSGRHSERAKKNHRDGMLLRMGTIRARIREIQSEIRLYKRFAHTKFARRVLKVLVTKKLPTRKRQLARYKARWNRLKREGKI